MDLLWSNSKDFQVNNSTLRLKIDVIGELYFMYPNNAKGTQTDRLLIEESMKVLNLCNNSVKMFIYK